jgi:UDP-GlcNAc:undecaprenyl-phosphate GlcNAc-1-phosphate transferase
VSSLAPALAIAGPFLFAFVASVVLVPLSRRLAVRFHYVAEPREDRWHGRPVAQSGGVAMVAAVFLGALVFGVVTPLSVLILTGALAFGIGIVDDLLAVKPATKFIAAIGLASILIFFGFRLQWSSSLTLDIMLTMFWIVGITNAFNLLDNMDGLCAGVALVVGGFILARLLPAGVGPDAQYLALLLGAVAGFLVYNFYPASIFMGDSGSLFIGLMLAALALSGPVQAHSQSGVLSIVLAPVLVLLIPILDTTLVTVSRLLSGRSAAQGGRDHSSHRLVAIGFSERSAVAVLWALAALAGLAGIAVQRVAIAWSGLMVGPFVLAMVIFAVYLANVHVYEDADAPQLRKRNITPLAIAFMYKRRVAEATLDVLLVSFCYYSAYRVRFSDAELVLFFPGFLQSLPIVLGLQMAAMFVFGVYRGTWRLFSLMDGVVIAKAVLGGTVAIVMTILYLNRFENYSRGVFIIYSALLMLLVTASRASFRLISEFAQRRRKDGLRLVIYGAGEGGLLAVRELLNDQSANYRLLGFADDNPATHQTRRQGYTVLGGYEALVNLIKGGQVDAIVISARLMDVSRLRQLEGHCTEHNVRLARLHVGLTPLVAESRTGSD